MTEAEKQELIDTANHIYFKMCWEGTGAFGRKMVMNTLEYEQALFVEGYLACYKEFDESGILTDGRSC